MADGLSNRLRARRESRGLSQKELGDRAELSRQSVGAIEAGRAIPAVDVALRLAQALGCTVEALFGPEPHEPLIDAVLSAPLASPRVSLAQVRGRWVAVPIGAELSQVDADGIVSSTHATNARVSPLGELSELRDNLVVMGCAVGLGLVTARARRGLGVGRFVWAECNNTRALEALASGLTHLAGVHSVLGADGEDSNAKSVRRAGVTEPVVLVTLARWQSGLVSRRDDTRVTSVKDLTGKGLRRVGREEGSGAEALFCEALKKASVPKTTVAAPVFTATGHWHLARAVAMGVGDVGVATRDAAVAFGLRFVPLAEERFDLVVPEVIFRDQRVAHLLEVMTTTAVTRELDVMGYQVSNTGNTVFVPAVA